MEHKTNILGLSSDSELRGEPDHEHFHCWKMNPLVSEVDVRQSSDSGLFGRPKPRSPALSPPHQQILTAWPWWRG